jgi:tripartite-type tricarboxylate transporter receptor subunit TctC
VLGAPLGALPFGAAYAAESAQDAPWKPSRPIDLVVPWAAGGATDAITRIVATVLEEALGQTIVIINQPGASGAIGTQSVLNAPRDGYTWAAGAVPDLGSYETLGSVHTRVSDWNLYLSVASVAVLSVGASSPYKTANDLIAAMKKRPGAITVATAGVTSSGHIAADLLAKAAHVTYRNVTYDGGNPAVVATVSGETDATTQLASEEFEMIQGKMLRPLCAISDKPLVLDGYGTVPPLSAFIPGFTAPSAYYGIFIPEGVPANVIQTMDRIWKTTVANSATVRKFAASHGDLFAPSVGKQAQALAFPAVQANAWMLYQNGEAKISPASVGIAAP